MASQTIISDNPLCACGCGESISLGKRFVHGHHRKGVECSPEHKAGISMANKGRIMTIEQRMVNSMVHCGLPSGMMGKHHSDESTEKLRIASTGRVASEATRRKLSECHKGRLVSEATKMKLSRAFKGKKLSAEHCEAIRLSHLGKSSPMEGKTHTEETKRKISEIHKGKVLSDEICQKMSLSKMGHNVAEETRMKISLSNMGKVSPMKGKTHSSDTKRKMRLATINRISIQAFNGMPMVPRIGIIESGVIDTLQNVCPYPIIRQHQVCGYFLDGYIPELNVAIEFDEAKHRLKIERDIVRQAEIEKELRCVFFRITPKQWKEKNDVLCDFMKLLRVA